MVILKKDELKNIAPLFDGWQETMIWSCLQGRMGAAWADDPGQPRAARIISGDFCFFAGEPDAGLVGNIPESYNGRTLLMTPQNEAWATLIEKIYGKRQKKIVRYAIKKEPDVFDREKLLKIAESLPPEYSIRQIDEPLYHLVQSKSWSSDFVSQFGSYAEFEKYGLGFVILHEGQPVSGASSYIAYDGGIEIEIDTKKDYHRRGLALVCAARLISECLNRGLYPSWDAANLASVALSEKLGYHFDKEYFTYEVSIQ